MENAPAERNLKEQVVKVKKHKLPVHLDHRLGNGIEKVKRALT